MASATLTFHPSDKSESNDSGLGSLIPSVGMPSRSTTLKGVALVVGVGVCYWTYCSASHWLENVSWVNFFRNKKEEP